MNTERKLADNFIPREKYYKYFDLLNILQLLTSYNKHLK